MPIGKSLHIGISKVDPKSYPDWNVELPSAENDAGSMKTVADTQGFASKILVTTGATSTTIIQAIREAAATLVPGDIFLLTYSGHGTTVPAQSGQKAENAWLAYDRLLKHSELRELLCQFKGGVRILSFSDCCHSGGVIPVHLISLVSELQRSAPLVTAVPATKVRAMLTSNPALTGPEGSQEKRLKASLLAFSSSKSDKNSIALTEHGLFTRKVLSIWDSGCFAGSYEQFFQAVRLALTKLQIPSLNVGGPHNQRFRDERPFAI